MMEKVGFFFVVGGLGICIFLLFFFFKFFNADHLLRRLLYLAVRRRRRTTLRLCSTSTNKVHASYVLSFFCTPRGFFRAPRLEARLKNAF